MEDIKIDEIANALRADILNLCHAIGLQGKADGNDFVAYNPTRADKHLGSFRVCIRGAKQGICNAKRQQNLILFAEYVNSVGS